MDDGLSTTFQTFKGFSDQVFAGLHQNLDLNIFGNAIFLDQSASEFIFCLAGTGKSNFDLLKALSHEKVEHLQLFVDAHRDGQGLVSVSEVDATPGRWAGNGLIRPGPIF